MILFTIYHLFTMNKYDRNGRRTPKYIQTKTKEKTPRLVALPSPVYDNGERLFSGVRKHRKTTRACPRWDGAPILVGQRNIGLGTVWAVKLQ